MKKLLFISIIIALAGCADMYQPTAPCPPSTLQYNVPNNHREPFGGSPDVWAAAVKITDSGKNVTLLFTEQELNFFKRRAHRNLSDTLK